MKITYPVLLALLAVSILSVARPAYAYPVTLTIQAVGGTEITLTQGIKTQMVTMPEAGVIQLRLEPGTYALKAQKIAPGFAGFQRVFLFWCMNLCCRSSNDSNPVTIDLYQDLSILANYITVYTGEKPCNISIAATDTKGKPLQDITVTLDSKDPVLRQQDRTNQEGEVTFQALTGTHQIGIQQTEDIDAQTTYKFRAWNDSSKTNPREVTIENDTELSVTYALGTYIQLQTTGLGSDIWTNIEVNDQNVTINDANPTKIWFPKGEETLLTADLTVPATKLGERYIFKAWSATSLSTKNLTSETLRITVNNAETIATNYKKQYQLTITSILGNPQGSGWYDEDSNATIDIEPYISKGGDMREAFEGWIGDLTSNLHTLVVTMTRPLNILADWKTQYRVSMLFKVANDNRTIQPNEAVLKSVANPTRLISLTSFSNIWIEAGKWMIETVIYEQNHLNAVPDTFTVDSPKELAFTCTIYDLTFTVRDLWGLPAAGATILLKLSNGTMVTTLTDSEGRARILSIPGGPLIAQITELFQVQISTNLSQTRGRPIEVVVTLSINSVTRIVLIAIIITALAIFVRKYPPKKIRLRLRKQRQPI